MHKMHLVSQTTKYAGYVLLIISYVFMANCSSQETPINANSLTRSIDNLDYRGPDSLCSDIEDIIDNPPTDITPWQTRVAELSLKNACRLPSKDLTLEIAEAELGDKDFAYQKDKNTLTIFARSESESQRACCSLQTSLLPVAKTLEGNIFAGRYQLNNLDAARLEFRSPNMKEKFFYKGFKAADNLILNEDELEGTHSEGVITSLSLDEKRAYQLYLPPNYKTGKQLPIVIIGDGVSLGYFIRQWEPLILEGKLNPFIAIGVLSGRRGVIDPQKTYDFDIRNSDYIKNYSKGPQRFNAHLDFVTDELLPNITTKLEISAKPESTILMGGSSGGSFAMWGVLSRPDIFGHSVAMSPSGPVNIDVSRLAASRHYYISAGSYEPNFHANAEFYQEALHAAGTMTDLKIYPDGHSSDHRELRMVDALERILSNTQNTP